MALAVERAWPDVALEGLVITRYAHGAPTERIRVVEAGHPVPDDAGEAAAHEIMQMVSQLQRDDLLLVLISGGGSSLLSLPVPDVPMSALKALTAALLASGAPIGDMNVVRKHLSQIQGGRLAAAAAARGAHVLALIISDVTGDAATDIASGPCAPDPSTYEMPLSYCGDGMFRRRPPFRSGCSVDQQVRLRKRQSPTIRCSLLSTTE